VRPLRGNPLLVAGVGFGLAIGGAWYPVRAYGKRFQAGAGTFGGADAIADQEQAWGRFRMMEAGLATGSSLAVALLASHVVVRVRDRR